MESCSVRDLGVNVHGGNTDRYSKINKRIEYDKNIEVIKNTYVNTTTELSRLAYRQGESQLYAIAYISIHEVLHQYFGKAGHWHKHQNNWPNIMHSGHDNIPVLPEENCLNNWETLDAVFINVINEYINSNKLVD